MERQGVLYLVEKGHACIKVKHLSGHRYQIADDGKIFFLKDQTRMLYFPNVEIIDPEGGQIQPSGQFLISASTVDPYHIATDYFR